MHEENYKGSKRGSHLIDTILSQDLKNELQVDSHMQIIDSLKIFD